MLRVWMKPDGIVEKRSRKGLIRMGSKQAENFKLSLAQFYGIPMKGYFPLGLVDPQRAEFINLSRPSEWLAFVFGNNVLNLLNQTVGFFITAFNNHYFWHSDAPFNA